MKCTVGKRFSVAILVALVLTAMWWMHDADHHDVGLVHGNASADTVRPSRPSPSHTHRKYLGDTLPRVMSSGISRRNEDRQLKWKRSQSNKAGAPFSWVGGGVTGPSVSDVEALFDELFCNVTGRIALMQQELDVRSLLHDGRGSATYDSLYEVISSTVLGPVTMQGLESDDCWIQLTPPQRIACIVAPALAMNATTIPSLSRSRMYLQSYCSSLAPCLQWRRGAFSSNLSSSMLEDIFHKEVAPNWQRRGMAKDDILSQLVSNFVHDEETFTAREKPFLWERHRQQETDMSKSHVLFVTHRLKQNSDGQLPVVDNESAVFMSDSAWVQSADDLRSVFQGSSLYYDHSHRRLTLRSHAEGGDEERRSWHHTSSLHMLAALHHILCVKRSRREAATRHQAGRFTEDVIVFSGDSMNRELFMRIIHHIRHGASSPPGNPYLEQVPFHEPSQQHDMLYTVYDDYDELDIFHSQMSNPNSPNTVSAYFHALRESWKQRRAARENHHNSSAEGVHRNALLRMVFFWDPQTDVYRPEALVAPLALVRTLERCKSDIVEATQFHHADTTDDDGLRIGPWRSEHLNRIDAWERRLMPNVQRPCEVLVFIGDPNRPQQHTLDFAQYRSLPESLLKRLGVTNASAAAMSVGDNGVCTAVRAEAAAKCRKWLARAYFHRYRVKPHVPLRELGVRIAVHVQGNIFWELERDVAHMQHLFALAASTEDDVPRHLRQLPVRAIPSDDTDFVSVTASFQDDLQPYLRHLSPHRFASALRHRYSPPVSESDVTQGKPSMNGDGSVFNSDDDEVVDHGLGGELRDDDDPLQNQGTDDGFVAALVSVAKSQTEHVPAPTDAITKTFENASGTMSTKWLDVVHRVARASSGTAPRVSTVSMLQRLAPHGPLEGLPLVPESRANLIKNMRHFGWFEQLAHTRSRQLRRETSRFRYVRSASLLDMGKLQSLRFAQGDNRHFSCRYGQVKDAPRFYASFRPAAFWTILSLGSWSADHDTQYFGGDGNSNLSMATVVTALVDMWSTPGRRDYLWNISGMAAVEAHDKALLADDRNRNRHHDESTNAQRRLHDLLAERIMHFPDAMKEYGCITYDDWDRCVDDANLFLAEIWLAKFVIRGV